MKLMYNFYITSKGSSRWFFGLTIRGNKLQNTSRWLIIPTPFFTIDKHHFRLGILWGYSGIEVSKIFSRSQKNWFND